MAPLSMISATIALVAAALAPARAQQAGAASPTPPRDPFRFEYVGPQSAGRVAAIAGVHGDTLTYYAGAASGGVWKTTDGGRTFTPVFDDQPVQAIGALAVAPSDPTIVWAGTGEAWAIRDSDMMGDGVYKSTDAGQTWTHMGLRETGRIGRIVIHPANPSIVFVCALGRATGPQEERGVFRTTDGGETWQRVLFVNPNTGCSGLAMDVNDPNVLFAGTWEVVMHTWAMFSGGPGSGVYVSRDGGTRWTRLERGLPKSPVGKIDVAVAPSDPRRVYALIQTANQGSLWRSDDGGASWRVVSWDRRLIGRAGYYIRVAVNPANPDEVLVANSSFHRSTDGGLTFPITGGGCGDCHDIWMDLKNPDHWAVTGDGGWGLTRNHGKDFSQFVLPIGQMYHVAIDEQVPYWIYSNRQDDGTMRGPTNRPVPVPNVPAYGRTGGGGGGGGGFGGGGFSAWQQGIGGCESGFTIPQLSDPNVIWATCYGNTVTRYDARVGLARHVSPWKHTLDHPPTDLKYRCHWTPPIAIDPFDHNTVYYGCQVIFKTENGGQSWTVISPDLSTQDPSRIVFSGGVIGDNLGQFYGEVVFAIAPSEIQRGLIWAGTNDGLIWVTTDSGANWTNVTKNVTGLPAWGTIRRIEPSRFDPNTAYVAVDFHLMDNREPYIYKTADLGRTWTRITGDLPSGHPLDYVLTVAENPNRRGMLFAGTGRAFYYSLDDGAHWTRFKTGLPAAPVTWIVVSQPFHDVVLSTYGRGLFVLRDVTPLERSDEVALGADGKPGLGGRSVHLYPPAAGFRQARSGEARFTFALASAPSDSVVVEVLDQSNAVIRAIKAAGREGLNRVTWDLRHDGPRQPELRTTPPDNPHIWEEARFKGKDTRPIIHWGIQSPQQVGPLAIPGTYRVRVSAAGVMSAAESFDVLKDGSITSSNADLALSTATQVRIRDAMNKAVDMINRLEVMRKQIEDQLKATAGSDGTARALRELDQKMLDVELRLLSRTDLHSDDKWYVESYKLYMQLVWLSGEVGTGAGDVQGGADHRPTDASLAWLEEIEHELAATEAAFTNLVEKEVPAFNRAMAGKVPAIALYQHRPR
ncbi:MAG TPA: hypothetical protein VNL18_05155 [Gemmatimonadales bacterium]|nr:hypothetical protein [Gemmatimonadales bacterium]